MAPKNTWPRDRHLDRNQRAHHILQHQPDDGNFPRVLVVRLLWFTDVTKILNAAWKKRSLKYGNSDIMIFRDMSMALYKKGKAFMPLKKTTWQQHLLQASPSPPIWSWTSRRDGAPLHPPCQRDTTWGNITRTCWYESVIVMVSSGQEGSHHHTQQAPCKLNRDLEVYHFFWFCLA